MSRILFLVHRIPFPPNKGDKIRSFNILRFLCEKHSVHLAAFMDSREDDVHAAKLEKYCESLLLRPIGGLRSKFNVLCGLLKLEPLGIGYYRDKRMAEWVTDLIDSGSVDSVIVFSSTMAQYALSAVEKKLPVVIDFVDVDSDKWRQYSKTAGFPKSLMYQYEARALAKWERFAASVAKSVTLVSNAERDVMREVLGQQKARIDVVRNGVDSMYFDPRIEDSSPYSDGAQIVVFTGAMDYFANEDAVVWFARNVWPQIMENEGNVRFHIVGHKPTAAVRALDQCPGITVEGGVPDIRPYLKHASVAVAPLRLARGVQNKVLEALAMNLPVVAAPQALQGLDGELPKTVRVAATEGEFITQVLDVIRNSKRISGNFGRRFILENYDWDTNLSVFECILEETASTKREGETHARRAKPLNHRGG